MNNNIKLIALLLIFVVSAPMAFAQFDNSSYFDDIGKYGSIIGPYGTARNQAIGGANTGLGGDMSSMTSNPAGIGFMTKSEFTISPGFANNHSNSAYRNNSYSGNNGKLMIPQMGLVLSNIKDTLQAGKFRGINIGLGFTRTNDYNQTYNYGGYASRNIVQTPVIINGDTARDADGFNIFNVSFDRVSYIDYLRNVISNYGLGAGILNDNTKSYEAAIIRQGFDGYLLDTNRAGQIKSFLPLSDMKQSGTITTRGRQNSFDLAFGGNQNDKFFFGGGVSIVSSFYESVSELKEQWTNVQPIYGQENPINKRYENSYYTIKQTNQFHNTGVNFKAGTIYRLNKFVRLGASYQSPTWSSITHVYTSELKVHLQDAPYGNSNLNENLVLKVTESDIDPYVYRLKTPGKLSAGMSIFFNNQGFISVDADYIDYTQGNVRDKQNASLASQSTKVNQTYKQAYNVRIGGEFRHDKMRFRAGYGFQDSPYRTDYVNDQTTSYNSYANKGVSSYSVGIGYREADWYIDMAIVNRQYSNGLLGHFYTPTVLSKVNQTNVMFTLGFPLD